MTSTKIDFIEVSNRIREAIEKHRGAIMLFALAAFVAGIGISAQALDFEPNQIDWSAIALLIPAAFFSILYGAANMQLMARCAGVRISAVKSGKTASVAQFAEFLPIPGGALVRGEALLNEGVKAGQAAAHVLVNAVLWLGVGAAAAGWAIGTQTAIGTILLASGLVACLACVLWLVKNAGLALAMAAFGIRLIGLVITALRLFIAFKAISMSVEFFESFPFAFANILGSASSLTPGGLGISETIAAALATITDINPAAAFIAVGLNRFIGLILSGTLTLVLLYTSRQKVSEIG
ncbi:MAG: lysylphosphatidylglycerol synthase domain-containing protein [Erythrobacter sp.]